MGIPPWAILLVPLLASATHASGPAGVAPAALPADAALEAAGARVGVITINAAEIFDLSDPHENKKLYRLALPASAGRVTNY